MTDKPLAFTGSGLDATSAVRDDEHWVAATLRAESTTVVVAGSDASIGVDPVDASVMAMVPVSAFRSTDSLILIGVDRSGAAVFCGDVADLGPSKQCSMRSLRSLAGELGADQAATAARAVGMVSWHARTRYCGICGSSTVAGSAGHRRICSGCDARHFPRTDPAVIMLVTEGSRCVLGRRPGSASGRWSTMAGFVEPGETPEAAVAREVSEETGLQVVSAVYKGSQPWPFPASLMIGFEAQVRPGELVRNDEHDELCWFAKDDLRRAVAHGSVSIPPPISLGFALITGWLQCSTNGRQEP